MLKHIVTKSGEVVYLLNGQLVLAENMNEYNAVIKRIEEKEIARLRDRFVFMINGSKYEIPFTQEEAIIRVLNSHIDFKHPETMNEVIEIKARFYKELKGRK